MLFRYGSSKSAIDNDSANSRDALLEDSKPRKQRRCSNASQSSHDISDDEKRRVKKKNKTKNVEDPLYSGSIVGIDWLFENNRECGVETWSNKSMSFIFTCSPLSLKFFYLLVTLFCHILSRINFGELHIIYFTFRVVEVLGLNFLNKIFKIINIRYIKLILIFLERIFQRLPGTMQTTLTYKYCFNFVLPVFWTFTRSDDTDTSDSLQTASTDCKWLALEKYLSLVL